MHIFGGDCGKFKGIAAAGRGRLPCMAALHSFRQARSRSRRAAIYGDRVFPKYLRKVFACGRRKILRRCAPLNDKSGGVPVLLSFRAKRGIFASADALPRPGLPHGGTPGWLLLASPIHLQVDCGARRRGDKKPAGGTGMISPAGEVLCPRRQSTQNAAGCARTPGTGRAVKLARWWRRLFPSGPAKSERR